MSSYAIHMLLILEIKIQRDHEVLSTGTYLIPERNPVTFPYYSIFLSMNLELYLTYPHTKPSCSLLTSLTPDSALTEAGELS